MRLSDMIRDRKEAILQDFEEFARTHTSPGSVMEVEALRDHAAAMLDTIAHDLEQPQTEAEQERKAKGDAAREGSERPNAAEEHGAARAHSGFSLNEAFAEYRALRASVMRHWTRPDSGSSRSDVEDVIRFNEAIDQALAESIYEYSRAVTGYREMFLAVLGHDLRSPLDAVLNASGFLADAARLSERDRRLVDAIHASGSRMKELIEDMLDYTSSQLGAAMPLRPREVDLGDVAREVVRQSEVTHPGREIRAELRGDLDGEWDVRRVRQAILNLIDNAVRHGAPDSPITVSAAGAEGGGEVVVAVHNRGAPIPPDDRDRIFEPFQRGASSDTAASGDRGSRGLGLYIARRMSEAHGGSLRVESTREEGTRFSIHLPRRPEGR